MRIGLQIFFCVLLCLTTQENVWSQSFCDGCIKNTNCQPIASASILLYTDSLLTPPIAGYGISQKDGTFHIELKEPKSYWLQVRCIGYEDFTKKLDDFKEYLNITLIQDDRTLDEVVVKGFYSGVKVKGDTIKFDTEHFKTGFERNLSDLLERLPGISISQDGNAMYGNKRVNTLLIDGKDIFTKETNGIVIKNMSADIVIGAEIIQKYKKEDAIEDFGRGTETALNIITKQKGKITGYIEGEYGLDDKYRAKSFTLGMNERFSLTSILSSNNIGQPVFSISDYVSRLLDSDDLVSSGNKSFHLSNMEAGLLYRPDNIYNDKSSVASFDAKYKASDILSVSANILYNRMDIEGESFRTEKYLSDSHRNVNNTSKETKNGNLLLSNIKVNWKPQNRIKVLAGWKLGVSDINNRQSAKSDGIGDICYEQTKHQRGIDFDGHVSATVGFESNQLYANAYITHSDKDHTLSLSTNNWILPIKYDRFDNLYYFQNSRSINPTRFSVEMGCDHSFSANYGLSTLLRYIHEKDKITTLNTSNLAEELNVQELETTILFKKIKGKFQFAIGSSIAANKSNLTPRFNNKKIELYPLLDAEYSFNATKKLSATISRSNDMIDIEKLTSSRIINGYNDIEEKSNISSPFQNGNKLFITYFSYDIERQNYFTVYLNMQKETNAVTPCISQNGIVSTTSYSDMGKTDEMYVMVNLDKRLKQIPVTLKGSLSANYLSTSSILNDEDYASKSCSILSKISILSTFHSNFNGELSLNYSHDWNTIDKANIKNITDNYYSKFKLLFRNGGWRCQAYVSYQMIRGNAYNNNVYDIGFKTEYKTKKVTLMASAENLLHLKENMWWRTLTTVYYSVAERYSRMPGYILLGASWNF